VFVVCFVIVSTRIGFNEVLARVQWRRKKERAPTKHAQNMHTQRTLRGRLLPTAKSCEYGVRAHIVMP
jgi:hypothetical protein